MIVEWFDCEKEPSADDLEVLAIDAYGNMYLVTHDSFDYFDQNCNKVDELVFWTYKPDLPRPKPYITNDLWVECLFKSKEVK